MRNAAAYGRMAHLDEAHRGRKHGKKGFVKDANVLDGDEDVEEAQHVGQLEDAAEAEEAQDAEEGGIADPRRVVEAVRDVDHNRHEDAADRRHKLEPAAHAPFHVRSARPHR